MADPQAYPGSRDWWKGRERAETLQPLPSVIAWHLVEKYLHDRIETSLGLLAEATDTRAMGIQQGRIAAYREMLNMRGTITVVPEEGKTNGA